MAMLVLAISTIVAVWVLSPLIPLETAVLRVLGLVIGCAVAYGAAMGGWSVWMTRGLAAAGLALSCRCRSM